MKFFETVTVVCDQGAGMQRVAESIRTFLEGLCLHVQFYDLVQKRDILKFLAGEFPPTRYTVICCHGVELAETGKQLSFEVVHQKDDDYEDPNGWERVTFGLTPANIAQYVRGNGRTILCLACGSGHEDFAQAFLSAECASSIAPRGAYNDSLMLRRHFGLRCVCRFLVNLFYGQVAARSVRRLPDLVFWPDHGHGPFAAAASAPEP